MTSRYRKERYGDMLQQILARHFVGMRDPRLQLVTITEVRVTGDLKIAKIFWTLPALSISEQESSSPEFFGSLPTKRVEDTRQALEKTKGLLRRVIAEQMKCRVVPELFFEQDLSAVYGSRIDAILDSL